MIILDVSKFFRIKWRMSPLLSLSGEDFGGVYHVLDYILQLRKKTEDKILIVTSEYKDKLRLHNENRFYDRSEEEKIANYIMQKSLLEKMISFLDVYYIYSEEFYSRQIIYTLLLNEKDNCVLYTADQDIFSILPFENVFAYEIIGNGRIEERLHMSTWELVFYGFSYFLEGVSIRSKPFRQELLQKEIKNMEHFFEFIESTSFLSKYQKQKIKEKKNVLENNYSMLLNGFCPMSELNIQKGIHNEREINNFLFFLGK
ncbi:MAG: hypothetical protein N3A54_03795 [Patescibacteria group bacterium]|nr:hypothetical protein [Patescibacteria group bacterium]